jgi:hypothetical protein
MKKKHLYSHPRSPPSPPADHTPSNRNYEINFDQSEILAQNNNKEQREVKETLIT